MLVLGDGVVRVHGNRQVRFKGIQVPTYSSGCIAISVILTIPIITVIAIITVFQDSYYYFGRVGPWV